VAGNRGNGVKVRRDGALAGAMPKRVTSLIIENLAEPIGSGREPGFRD
jgi:hypothetical protein